MLHKNAVEPITLELLKQICLKPEFAAFALGGGTNISLRKGHRLSVDLDFFTSKTFNTADIYKAITKSFTRAELLFEQNQTMMFLINNVKVDFVLYPFEWVKPFDQIEICRLIHIEDIIPMKLQALSNRFSKKDFWDVEFLLREISLEKMLEIFKLKFPPIDTGYLIHSLTNFETADSEVDPVCLIPATWKVVKDNLQQVVRDYTAKSM
ncbi:MAG: nucleotidyl transferase AbiEii/AbiGii toxin family protein [Ferruginibacter sp.]|nr:nucleotidyl transferase AbiEii/AbiGii toxin family protein [Chitinophagaceae bacterium]